MTHEELVIRFFDSYERVSVAVAQQQSVQSIIDVCRIHLSTERELINSLSVAAETKIREEKINAIPY